MEEIIVKIQEYWPALAELSLAIMIAATVIVRATPSETDDEKVSKIASILMKIISYLPTIGLNPRTKKLEEALKELKESKK